MEQSSSHRQLVTRWEPGSGASARAGWGRKLEVIQTYAAGPQMSTGILATKEAGEGKLSGGADDQRLCGVQR